MTRAARRTTRTVDIFPASQRSVNLHNAVRVMGLIDSLRTDRLITRVTIVAVDAITQMGLVLPRCRRNVMARTARCRGVIPRRGRKVPAQKISMTVNARARCAIGIVRSGPAHRIHVLDAVDMGCQSHGGIEPAVTCVTFIAIVAEGIDMIKMRSLVPGGRSWQIPQSTFPETAPA